MPPPTPPVRRGSPTPREQLWLWARWLASALGLILLARLLTGLLVGPDSPASFAWGAAVLLGLAATFMLLPMPTEHWWDQDR